MLQLPDTPRHRKRAPKHKPFVIRWHWTGDRSKFPDTTTGRIQLMLVSDWHQRYETAKAAAQALEDWERGRGTWGAMRRPPLWTAVLVPPTPPAV